MSACTRTTRVVVLSVALAAYASACYAAGPMSGHVVLGYGESYRAAEGTTVHRGVDVALLAGEPVRAPVAGVVSFAGRIPTSSGGTVLCVTVRSGDDAVTVSPLEGVDVVKGDRIEAGTEVGTLAESGDPSSEEPHVHVSLRREGVYLDPSGMLSGLYVRPTDLDPVQDPLEAVPRTAAQVPPAPLPADAGVAVPGVEAAPAVVIGAVDPRPADAGASPAAEPGWAGEAPAGTLTGETLVGGGVGYAAVGAPFVSHSGPVGPSGVFPAPGSTTQVRSAAPLQLLTETRDQLLGVAATGAQTRAGRAAGSGTGAWRAMVPETGFVSAPRLADAVGQPHAGFASRLGSFLSAVAGRAFTPGGVAALTAVLLSLTYLASRRAFTRRIAAETPVSYRFGSMLQHLRAGDTLCGLTSCSGLLPSQSRGRLAQRR